MPGLRVALAAFLHPPFAETGDGERGCFVGSSQVDRAAVGLSIVDAIRNGDAFSGRTEVMIVDGGRGSLPFDAGVPEVTDQLPLFGVHAQNRITAFLKPIPLPAEIAELTVAVGSGTGRDRLAVGTQAILHLP